MKESIAQVKLFGPSPSRSQHNSSLLTPVSTPKTKRLVKTNIFFKTNSNFKSEFLVNFFIIHYF